MDITDIRIRRIETMGKLKAVVSVTFDDMFAVHDMKIIEGQSGYFIAMPSRRTPNGEYKDIAHPINAEARSMIQNAILEKFESLPDDKEYASFPV
jgi:stage V sporulation protein G